MNRRQTIVVVGLGAVLLASIASLVWILTDGSIGEPQPDIVDEEDHYTVTDDELAVNGTAVMNDSGFIETATSIQVSRGQYIMDLSLFGAYEGNLFYFGQYPLEATNPQMELGPEIVRGDPVIEAYMIGRLTGPEDDLELEVDIYYDDAFRQRLGSSPNLIMWNQAQDTIEQYNYTEEQISDGLYKITFVTDQTDRFRFSGDESNANIFFGDVSIAQGQPVIGRFMVGLQ